MKTSVAETVRKPRADAQSNRGRILEDEKQAFTRRGAEASMDEIAKRAKIGSGTLYRHFPSRDDLRATVYTRVCELVNTGRFPETPSTVLENGSRDQSTLMNQFE